MNCNTGMYLVQSVRRFSMWLDTFHLITQPIGIEYCTIEEKN